MPGRAGEAMTTAMKRTRPVPSQEPAWSEPPVGDELAALLRERWRLMQAETLSVEVIEGEARALSLTLAAEQHLFRIRVAYLRGAGPDRDPWMLMADALDALLGQLLEEDRDHRALPTGSDVEYEGAVFEVHVEKQTPELDALADALLMKSGGADPGTRH